MSGYADPPKGREFSSDYQPTKKRGPSVLTPLKKFLKKKIKYEDPETKEMVTGKIEEVIALRLILNATQGEFDAIREILDRIDGKVIQTKASDDDRGFDTYFIQLIRKHNEELKEQGIDGFRITKFENRALDRFISK